VVPAGPVLQSLGQPAIDCWADGGKVRKLIGYDAGTKDRKRYAQAVGVEDPKYDYWYPLVEWGWERERCKAEIVAAGLPVPVKSACYFCPATQPAELHEMAKVYLRYIVIMEARADAAAGEDRGAVAQRRQGHPGRARRSRAA
jgi:hypothetical protein